MEIQDDATDVVGLRADPHLLSRPELLPSSAGSPPPGRVLESRDRIVGTGAALTGASLIGGAVLTLAALIDLIVEGGLLAVIGLLLGIVLVSTHWGWVHVAEARADALQRRLDVDAEEAHGGWLATIAPFSRYEITTRPHEDGSVTIERIRLRPVTHTAETFTFEREVELSETHPGEEAGEVIAERAELLRREAAQATERARVRYESALGIREQRDLEAEEERERERVRSAESRALSEQINTRLRDPPLSE